MEDPLYVQLAQELREGILSGQLAPGHKLPSRPQLVRDRGVSSNVVNAAFDQLEREGLIERRPGSGTYVKERPRLRRLLRTGLGRAYGAPPFLPDLRPTDGKASFRCMGETGPAPVIVAERLGMTVGADVVRIEYVWYVDSEAAAVASSWEPGDLVRGTPIAFPEEGPHALSGVVARMRVIGVQVDRVVEWETARPATADEAVKLTCPEGTLMLVIWRTYFAGERAVATAEIAIPTTRWVVERELQISEESA
ncbi:GntR family transcriptional regulator [Nonomuraea angiospora]|uniref:GntR family transcriptional regulator n=1 Tax=Nonomuraea angiospora TaxID=46172 RepID=UPI0029BE5A71|nr:GntR family transcriptional regulator [Nonomuraea angiospora]MDX3106082.1 GntR family transcriptional regulator [Nonomuraea angiospora]